MKEILEDEDHVTLSSSPCRVFKDFLGLSGSVQDIASSEDGNRLVVKYDFSPEQEDFYILDEEGGGTRRRSRALIDPGPSTTRVISLVQWEKADRTTGGPPKHDPSYTARETILKQIENTTPSSVQDDIYISMSLDGSIVVVGEGSGSRGATGVKNRIHIYRGDDGKLLQSIEDRLSGFTQVSPTSGEEIVVLAGPMLYVYSVSTATLLYTIPNPNEDTFLTMAIFENRILATDSTSANVFSMDGGTLIYSVMPHAVNGFGKFYQNVAMNNDYFAMIAKNSSEKILVYNLESGLLVQTIPSLRPQGSLWQLGMARNNFLVVDESIYIYKTIKNDEKDSIKNIHPKRNGNATTTLLFELEGRISIEGSSMTEAALSYDGTKVVVGWNTYGSGYFDHDGSWHLIPRNHSGLECYCFDSGDSAATSSLDELPLLPHAPWVGKFFVIVLLIVCTMVWFWRGRSTKSSLLYHRPPSTEDADEDAFNRVAYSDNRTIEMMSHK